MSSRFLLRVALLSGLAPLAHGVATAEAQTYPVTVRNCFATERFDGPPKRALVNDTGMVQTVLDLGLADRFVGVSGIEGTEGKLVGDPAVIAGLKQFAPRQMTVEAVLGQDPDFVFAGWNYGFRVSSGVTPQVLATFGIKTYALRESCIKIGRREPIGMDTLYADLDALGDIFGVRARTDALVDGLRGRVAEVSRRLEGIGSRPRIVYCDACDSASPPVSAGREAMTALIMRLGGGENIFDDVGDSYVRVNWEEIARRDPQWIIVNDHRIPIERTIAHLLSDPQLSHVEAIRRRQFIPLTYAEQTVSTRSVDGLEKIARAIHPDRFW